MSTIAEGERFSGPDELAGAVINQFDGELAPPKLQFMTGAQRLVHHYLPCAQHIADKDTPIHIVYGAAQVVAGHYGQYYDPF